MLYDVKLSAFVLNRNICMLMENYRARGKRSKNKVKKELTR
jgi:hypothetical protein